MVLRILCLYFFFNDTATTEIYTLSLHDALPIWRPPQGSDRVGPWPAASRSRRQAPPAPRGLPRGDEAAAARDRKSTRLNSSHANISYAVFCLKKNNKKTVDRIDHVSV